MKIQSTNNYKKFDVYMFIFNPKKGQNIAIITKKGEKILMSEGGFMGKFYFGLLFK